MLKLPARINGISSTSVSTVVSGPLQSVRDRRIQSGKYYNLGAYSSI